jgi:hypothetical protein
MHTTLHNAASALKILSATSKASSVLLQLTTPGPTADALYAFLQPRFMRLD